MRKQRVTVVFVLLLIGLGVIEARLLRLQVVEHELWERESVRSTMTVETVPFGRGWILDRHGEPLAMTEEVRALEFEFGRWRKGAVVGQVSLAYWLVNGERIPLDDAVGRLSDYVDGLGDMTLEHFRSLTPDKRRVDLLTYLKWIYGEPFEQALEDRLSQLSAGLDVAGVRLAELDGWGPGRDEALRRADREWGALSDLARLCEVVPFELLGLIQEKVDDIDVRVARGLDAVLSDFEGAALRVAAAAGVGSSAPGVPAAWFEPEDGEPSQPSLAGWVRGDLRAEAIGLPVPVPWREAAFLRERQLHQDLDGDARLLVSAVPYDAETLVAVRADDLAGFSVSARARRVYPDRYADTAPNLVGRVGDPGEPDLELYRSHRAELLDLQSLDELTAEELARYETLRVLVREVDYRYEEERGILGAEQAFESVLRGKRGWVARARPGVGQGPQIIEEALPVRGLNLTLTLDIALQQAAEEVLDAVRADPDSGWPGAIVLLDPRTGEVLTAATGPRADRHDLTFSYDADHPDGIFANRALGAGNLPPPGSTFKAVTALAALTSGAMTPSRRYECVGTLHPDERGLTRPLGCLGNHGSIGLRDAMARSCNIYFYHAAEDTGGEALASYARRLGLGRSTSMIIGNEVLEGLGIYPDSGIKEWSRPLATPAATSEIMRLGIGQAPLDDVTPIQVASLLGAVGVGYLRPPSLVKSIEGLGPMPPRERIELGATAAQLAAVRAGLHAVVNWSRGTAWTLGLQMRHVAGLSRPGVLADLGFEVAGKTGTPEVGGGLPDHSWFAGYLPADDPQLAFAIFLEHTGEHGGDACVPVAVDLFSHPEFQAYLRREVLP